MLNFKDTAWMSKYANVTTVHHIKKRNSDFSESRDTDSVLVMIKWLFIILNPSLAEHNMPCLSKQCRSRSVGF